MLKRQAKEIEELKQRLADSGLAGWVGRVTSTCVLCVCTNAWFIVRGCQALPQLGSHLPQRAA